MAGFRPLLGYKVKDLREVQLPTLASFKIDGWRATWFVREFFTRTGKCVPNRAVQREFYQLMIRERQLCDGWDGELVYGEPNAADTFVRTESVLSSPKGSADGIRWFVFDAASAPGDFARRLDTLRDLPPRIFRLDHEFVENYSDLEALEERAVSAGFEGLVCRSPGGRYKNGRSTLREQYLLKVKRYIDEEVTIIRLEERMHNANPAFANELGYTKRSTAREGKIPAGTLGRIIVNWRGKDLGVGTGWTQDEAQRLWLLRDTLPGKTGVIKYSPAVKDLPRQPVWKGLRSDI